VVRRSLILVLTFGLLPVAAATASANSPSKSSPKSSSNSSDAALAERYRHGDAPNPFLDALAEGRLDRQPPSPSRQHGYRAAAVPVGWALTGAELAPFDVTDTDAGRGEVAALRARLRSRGVNANDVPYVVYSLPGVKGAAPEGNPQGDPPPDDDAGPLASALVVPKGTTVELVGDLYDDNGLHVVTLLSGAPRQPEIRGQAAPSDSLEWRRHGGLGCFGRVSNNTARYDPCQHFSWLIGDDGDPDHQTLGNEMWGTGKSKGFWVLKELEVQSYPEQGTAPQRWVEWDPKSDTKTDCQNVTVGITVKGVGLSVDQQRCELWDIEKGVDPADFANRWKGSVRRGDRAAAMVTATEVDTGDLPTYRFEFDYYAR
jgi:hypothetical protein